MAQPPEIWPSPPLHQELEVLATPEATSADRVKERIDRKCMVPVVGFGLLVSKSWSFARDDRTFYSISQTARLWFWRSSRSPCSRSSHCRSRRNARLGASGRATSRSHCGGIFGFFEFLFKMILLFGSRRRPIRIQFLGRQVEVCQSRTKR